MRFLYLSRKENVLGRLSETKENIHCIIYKKAYTYTYQSPTDDAKDVAASSARLL